MLGYTSDLTLNPKLLGTNRSHTFAGSSATGFNVLFATNPHPFASGDCVQENPMTVG